METTGNEYYDIIIAGAGIAGLYAARELSRAGHRVLLLEARERLGGRIHTQEIPGFPEPVELGPEFIHGRLPITVRLLDEYKITYHSSDGEMYRFTNGRLAERNEIIEGDYKLLEQKLDELGEDMSVEEFLRIHFSEPKYDHLRASIRGFVRNFDAADTAFASTLGFKKEWQESEEEMFRVDKGYGQLVNHLASECRDRGCTILTSSVVSAVHWEKGRVSLKTRNDNTYSASKALFTLPPSLLFHQEHPVLFSPGLDDKRKASLKARSGNAIKVFLRFKNAFWEASHNGALKDMGILISDEAVPVWWTQFPLPSALLTGWVAGKDAEGIQDKEDDEILTVALESLSTIFGMPVGNLQDQLLAWKVSNWIRESYSGEAYSYTSYGESGAREVLSAAVEGTLFFAGEAYNTGEQSGTVEAALESSVKVVAEMK